MARVLMQGNEAIGWGALAGGCRFYAGYPITPSSEIAEFLARELPKVGGKFIQMEDEIASIAAVIGASIGGMRAMTATSGPGFSLMQENIGYAAMAEIPCVIVDVQRLGPSTGQPTAPSQGDVMQARWGTHGDHPIIVLCPVSVRQAFDLTVRAFDLSEKYRTPVVLLTDAVIGHMREAVELPDWRSVAVTDYRQQRVEGEYFPYRNTPEGVPPLISFGLGYRYHITGLFHDERGFPTQRLDEINPWLERVHTKLERHREDIVMLETDIQPGAEVMLIAYGAAARSARHALRQARAAGRKVSMITPLTIWPFPEEEVERLCEDIRRVVVPEMNLGQLALEVERVVGRKKVRRVTRADGEMILPSVILAALEEDNG